MFCVRSGKIKTQRRQQSFAEPEFNALVFGFTIIGLNREARRIPLTEQVILLGQQFTPALALGSLLLGTALLLSLSPRRVE